MVGAILALTFVSTGVGMVAPYLFGKVADEIMHKQSISLPIMLVLGMSVLKVSRMFIGILRQRVDYIYVWYPIQEKLRFAVLKSYLALSIGQLSGMSSGMSREILNNGESAMMSLARASVQRFLPMVIQFIMLTAILFWHHALLAVTVLCGLCVYTFCQWKMEKQYTPRIASMRDKGLASSKVRGDVLLSALLIKSCSKEEYARKLYRKKYLDSVETSRETNFFISLSNTSISVIIELTQMFALIVGIVMVYQGSLTFGYLITVQVWWSQMCSLIETVGDEYQDILKNIGDVRKFFELIDTPPAIYEIDQPVRLSEASGFIRFNNVSFTYPPRKKEGDAKKLQLQTQTQKKKREPKKVVDGVSFLIRAGERVAIVGPSGSGKSTLVKLLQRGYDPDTGIIEIDGINLRNLDRRTYYQQVAIVDQSSLTMNLSIRENIRLGAHRDLSDEEVLMMCRMAQLNIDEFDDGLDTTVGEMGGNVSGGERQRIAIARALAANPRILIFDEPTSSLDAMTEARIKKTIDSASEGRTSITIAHRLCTIQNANRIFVMEKGRITAVGTHRELMNSSGTYMEFVEQQQILV